MTVRWIGLAAMILVCLSVSTSAPEARQAAFSHTALDARLPVARRYSYGVNAKIRPLLLFWIGREDVGDASLTWRQAADGRRALEFLIGSDPLRAPRGINRWGFIVEELGPDTAEILGVMSHSDEETLDEAEANFERRDGQSPFKAARTTVRGSRASGGTMTVDAPARLTYRDLDALLALMPPAPPTVLSVDLPDGAEKGFLIALERLLGESVESCRPPRAARQRNVSSVPYLYNQTVFDLALTSCQHEVELRGKTERFADVVDGRFLITNRTTKSKTEFRIVYGASGDLLGIPVRAVFRPRWWLEIELLLEPTR